jgi:hypothetical protein
MPCKRGASETAGPLYRECSAGGVPVCQPGSNPTLQMLTRNQILS